MKDLNQLGKELSEHSSETTIRKTDSLSNVFANAIFSSRLDNGMTQKELADLSGVSTKTIHCVEAGDNGVSIKTYEKIFKSLGVMITDKNDNGFLING
ncbi:transcriptional regulator with XRE-family HTH domain [Alkalihalobacillus xiaoxiensis]|uniref:Transcriptional regulator with XRE-family HTH domain n=1 Tax=Shouchella xiaoxiensis TaxID=766895 RepID=A0ABS2SW89_9BACI|nr:helix-turn-helix transcriptional regulator [Shouchella xiaoxiensis]MBM7839431.1 transcriptional regulator with XRE-family HTH domain [Shouchella xiaoxiensis]